jgi:hypothetical protein
MSVLTQLLQLHRQHCNPGMAVATHSNATRGSQLHLLTPTISITGIANDQNQPLLHELRSWLLSVPPKLLGLCPCCSPI